MQISFFIAKRYAEKQPIKTLLHRLSRLSCYSTALGTAILLLVLSTMNGMEGLLSSLFYSYTSALKIAHKSGNTFCDNHKLQASIRNIPAVTDVVEILEATALIRFNGQQAIATIKGVSPNFAQSDFYRNCTRMDATTFLATNEGKNQAIIGIQLSRLLTLTGKKEVVVFYPQKNSPTNRLYPPSYKRKTLEVNGLFSITPAVDSKYIIAPINFVEGLTNCLHRRTHWEVIIENENNLADIQAAIQKFLPNELKLSNRHEQNEAKYRAIAIERLSVYFIFFLVLLLASLHIFFMLCMLIAEKRKDIATLTSLGATSNQIGKIFFYNGLWISLEGIVYGLMLGLILGYLQQKFGFIKLATLKSTGLLAYPIKMKGSDFLCTAGCTMLLDALASIWPAKQAMKLAKSSTLQQTTS